MGRDKSSSKRSLKTSEKDRGGTVPIYNLLRGNGYVHASEIAEHESTALQLISDLCLQVAFSTLECMDSANWEDARENTKSLENSHIVEAMSQMSDVQFQPSPTDLFQTNQFSLELSNVTIVSDVCLQATRVAPPSPRPFQRNTVQILGSMMFDEALAVYEFTPSFKDREALKKVILKSIITLAAVNMLRRSMIPLPLFITTGNGPMLRISMNSIMKNSPLVTFSVASVQECSEAIISIKDRKAKALATAAKKRMWLRAVFLHGLERLEMDNRMVASSTVSSSPRKSDPFKLSNTPTNNEDDQLDDEQASDREIPPTENSPLEKTELKNERSPSKSQKSESKSEKKKKK